ncbi:hypothetical protein ETB97_007471 [Aspergillus alliaceus]|uniref:Uncharacterized protein n=1 Tax=Petromyces alliaceus TaxID=209559 RepID=A0A8H5ZXT6_PETAA|nr:hypothetical protein ETB97_007471 [Aspergillus burnettii]
MNADFQEAECEGAQHHLIIYAFNLPSDIAILCIPIPAFLSLQLLWRKKLVLFGVHPNSVLWIFWYVREGSTVLIVTNAPNCYSFLRRLFKIHGFMIFGTYIALRWKPTHPPESGQPDELAQFSIHRPRKRTTSTESTENITGKDKSFEI